MPNANNVIVIQYVLIILFTEDQREFYTTITIYKSDTGSTESWEEIK